MTKPFYVYLHKTLDGLVFYVGKGKARRAWSKCSRSLEWKEIVNRCGLEVELIAVGLSEDEAYAAEMEAVSHLRSSGAQLCNKTSGGGGASGRVMTDDHKRKIGSANRIALAGKTLSGKTRSAISEKLRGRRLSDEHRSNLRGRSRNKAHADALSMALIGNKNCSGLQKSESHKLALSQAAKARSARKVVCVDTGQEFATVRDAAEHVRPGSRAADGNIVACCKGRLNSAYGRTWKYFE